MSQANKFLQWNIRGFLERSDELRYLLNMHRPLVIALQETKFPEGDSRQLPGYICQHKEPRVLQGGRRHGGVAIYTLESLGARLISVNTSLQAVAVRLETPTSASVCSIYLSGGRGYDVKEVKNVIDQMHAPVVVLGDFNTHNVSWGSRKSTPQGRLLHAMIEELGLVVLNDGSPTHFTESSGTFDSIDLTMTSISVVTYFRS